MDRVGPMTRTAEDAAIVFNVIHGGDAKDPGSLTMPFHFDSNINLAKLRIGMRKQTAQTPDPVYARFYYSHPPASERLARLSAA